MAHEITRAFGSAGGGVPRFGRYPDATAARRTAGDAQRSREAPPACVRFAAWPHMEGQDATMRLGLNLGYQAAWTTPADHLALAQEADRLGFAVVWTAEAYGSDSPSMLAWIAGQTQRIDVGVGRDADPGPYAGDDRDDGRHHRRVQRRPVPARPRRLGSPGLRGLARRTVRPAARAHPRIRRHRTDGARSRTGVVRRASTTGCRCRTARARRCGSRCIRCATTSRSTWPRSARAISS